MICRVMPPSGPPFVNCFEVTAIRVPRFNNSISVESLGSVEDARAPVFKASAGNAEFELPADVTGFNAFMLFMDFEWNFAE